jgi:hypothetical protein
MDQDRATRSWSLDAESLDETLLVPRMRGGPRNHHKMAPRPSRAHSKQSTRQAGHTRQAELGRGAPNISSGCTLLGAHCVALSGGVYRSHKYRSHKYRSHKGVYRSHTCAKRQWAQLLVGQMGQGDCLSPCRPLLVGQCWPRAEPCRAACRIAPCRAAAFNTHAPVHHYREALNSIFDSVPSMLMPPCIIAVKRGPAGCPQGATVASHAGSRARASRAASQAWAAKGLASSVSPPHQLRLLGARAATMRRRWVCRTGVWGSFPFDG